MGPYIGLLAEIVSGNGFGTIRATSTYAEGSDKFLLKLWVGGRENLQSFFAIFYRFRDIGIFHKLKKEL